MEILEEDSQNIVDLIRRKYEQITSTISIKVDGVPDSVIVKIKSNCGENGDEEILTDSCQNVELGKSIDFVAEIQARECLESPVTIAISPVGLNQTLHVVVDTICDCQCELPGM